MNIEKLAFPLNCGHINSEPLDVFSSSLFKGSVAVVTGGGTGIGLEIARWLLALGAQVAICGRTMSKLEKARSLLRDELKSFDDDALFCHTCDIRDEKQVEAFVDAVLQRYQHLDILVNNAGGQYPSLAENITPRGFDAVVRNNLSGTWIMTRSVALRAFIPQRSGRIVNIVAQVRRGFPTMAHTGAARAAVINLTKTLAVEWARFNICVNAVAPGVITSSGTLHHYGDQGEQLLNACAKVIPLRRTGTVAEVASLVVFLASARSAAFVSGETVYLDGAQNLHGSMYVAPIETDATATPQHTILDNSKQRSRL